MTIRHELEAQVEGLFAAHQEVLAKKSVSSKQALMLLMAHDLEKLTCALSTVQRDCAGEIVASFFDVCPAVRAKVQSAVGQVRLYHLGFEIHQPLDILTARIPDWLAALSGTWPDAPAGGFKLARVFRFPASISFQRRVGAYAEIMRVYIEAGERELMLELFDIHRGPDAPMSQRTFERHRRAAKTPRTNAPHECPEFERLFRGDPVWHYALYVESAEKVIELHDAFRELVAQVPSYVLAYAEPVTNQDDGSFHTKIINREQTMEIELVTQLPQAVV